MIDSLQILLTATIALLTLMLTIIGVQVFQILRELKKSIEKLNGILDDAHKITSSIARQVEEASGLLTNLKQSVNVLNFINKVIQGFKEKKDSRKQVLFEKEKTQTVSSKESSLKDDIKQTTSNVTKAIKKRFFKKSGKDLIKPY
jgi:hypothetical protein